MLEVDFLRAPAVGELVLDDLLDLRVGAGDPGDALRVDVDLRGKTGGHDDCECSTGEPKPGRRRAASSSSTGVRVEAPRTDEAGMAHGADASGFKTERYFGMEMLR